LHRTYSVPRQRKRKIFWLSSLPRNSCSAMPIGLFCAAFFSNVQNDVASVFELSSKAYSYAKDKTHYSLSAYPENDLVVFKAIDQVTGEVFILDNGTVDIIFRLTNLVKACR
jgi:hypothetical protein